MTFLSAFLLGLLASAHCAGMCGGLQAALQQPTIIRSASESSRHLIALNLGRLSIYTLAGILFSVLGNSIINLIDVPRVTQIARYFTAVILLMIGFQLLISNRKPFLFIEQYGAALWSQVSKKMHDANSNKLSRSFSRGLIWGFLPCGLVYGVLMTTLFSQSLWHGGAIMLGFGLGTLPAMVLTGSFYQRLRNLVRNTGIQLVGGIVFIQGGALMLFAPWFTNMDFTHTYPQIMSTLFCFS